MNASIETRLVDFWWNRVPRVLTAAPGFPGAILKDGDYLRAWPRLAAWLPFGAAIFGAVSGIWHFNLGPTYTFSLVLTSAMLVLSSAGAVIGLWLCLGYAVSDFLLYGHFGSQPDFSYLVGTGFSLLLSYLLLGLLLVRSVFLATALTHRMLSWMKPSPTSATIIQAVLQGVIQGGLVWVWAHSVPSLIRPVFTWNGGYPPTEAMQPLQENGGILVAIGAVGGAARAIAEYFAARKAAGGVSRKLLGRIDAAKVVQCKAKFPVEVRLGVQSCFTTFMLSGLLASWIDALLLAGALFLIRYGAQRLAGKLAAWDGLLLRVPFFVRILAGLAVSYFLAEWIVTALWSQTDTFRPVLISVVLSLAFIVLLTPESRKAVVRLPRVLARIP